MAAGGESYETGAAVNKAMHGVRRRPPDPCRPPADLGMRASDTPCLLQGYVFLVDVLLCGFRLAWLAWGEWRLSHGAGCHACGYGDGREAREAARVQRGPGTGARFFSRGRESGRERKRVPDAAQPSAHQAHELHQGTQNATRKGRGDRRSQGGPETAHRDASSVRSFVFEVAGCWREHGHHGPFPAFSLSPDFAGCFMAHAPMP
jgi:hypothetical protein